MRILCHVGPWCVKQYSAIAHAVDSSSAPVLASGFMEIDQSGLAKNFYRNLKDGIVIDKEFDSDDFIQRCRLLRSIDRSNALLHLHAMKCAVSRMFDEHSPDLVISEIVDQYVIDLIRHECVVRGIPFFGLVVSFINGYFRITSRGEYTQVRDKIDDDEVKAVLDKLESNAYVPQFVARSKNSSAPFYRLSKRVISNWARIPYFYLKRIVTGEKSNYHYWASQKSAMENFHIAPRFWLGEREWKKNTDNAGKPIVYVPLQMYPEATIEYWCEHLDMIEYHEKLINIIKSYGSDLHFVIKEHPNVLGFRDPGIYKKLSSLVNVTMTPVSENSNEIIKYSDAVLVWTGTVGFEAALRGKPVLTVCTPYYASGEQFMMVKDDTPVATILEFIKKQSVPLDGDEKEKLVLHLLKGLVPGKYTNDASWCAQNQDDIREADTIGEFIRLELESEHGKS